MSVASEIEQEMLALINNERAIAGLDPLAFNGRLNDASEVHSQWMLDVDVLSHRGAGGSSPTERMEDAGYVFEGAWSSGENVAYQSERGEPGLSDDVADLHAGLMNSPGHRANILNPDFTEIGIGIELGDWQTSGTVFDAVVVTQNFATSAADNADDPAPTAPDDDQIAQPGAIRSMIPTMATRPSPVTTWPMAAMTCPGTTVTTWPMVAMTCPGTMTTTWPMVAMTCPGRMTTTWPMVAMTCPGRMTTTWPMAARSTSTP